jgi:hypothetical protein
MTKRTSVARVLLIVGGIGVIIGAIIKASSQKQFSLELLAELIGAGLILYLSQQVKDRQP